MFNGGGGIINLSLAPSSINGMICVFLRLNFTRLFGDFLPFFILITIIKTRHNEKIKITSFT